nr:uncharacterized protein LOC128701670 [Cherax quadricarinatus]
MPLKLLMLLVPLVIGISPSFTVTSTALFNRTGQNENCGTIFKIVNVPSLTICAAICNKHTRCIGFGFGTPGGSKTTCEMANETVSCVPQDHYNFYQIIGYTNTTPPPDAATSTNVGEFTHRPITVLMPCFKTIHI